MQFHTIASEEDEKLSKRFIELEVQIFSTARGLEFTYHVKRNRQGEMLSELVFDRKEKTITRNTVLLAY